MPWGVTIVLMMSALLGLACGGGNGGDAPRTEEDQVRSVASEFASAAAKQDFEKACSLMTTEAKADLLEAAAFLGNKGGGCEGVLDAAFSFLDEGDKQKLENYEIKSVTIRGDRARLSDTSDEGVTRLRKKGGKWLIDKDPDTKGE